MGRLRRRRDDEPDQDGNDYSGRRDYPGSRDSRGGREYPGPGGYPLRGIPYSRWRANGWSVLPMRLFLAALFGFAGYAKLTYPRFFDPASPNGFKAAVGAAKDNTPLGGLLNPLADHPSVYGHITAYAEIAIGLGLLVGLLIRLAALGGMVLTTMILLSIDWGGVKEYTGSSGWFTAVDLVIAVALSVFLLGGAGPLALDNLFIRARERQRARDDAEPSFRESEIEDSRRRLQGEPVPAAPVAAGSAAVGSAAAGDTTRVPAGDTARVPDGDTARVPDRDTTRVPDRDTARVPDGDAPTAQFPAGPQAGDRRPAGGAGYADRAGQLDDEEYRDDPEPEPNSLWTQGRRTSGQPPAEPRRDG